MSDTTNRPLRIFVAAWFYPPSTSSEGLATYKLLRRSVHSYDVMHAVSNRWGYAAQTLVDHGNDEGRIRTFPVTTDDVDVFVETVIGEFSRMHEETPYDCLMTRSMPTDSLQIGLRLKHRFPGLKWIASIADPVGNDPYLNRIILDGDPADDASFSNTALTRKTNTLPTSERTAFKQALAGISAEAVAAFDREDMPKDIRLLCRNYRMEHDTLETADLVIAPTERQLLYMASDRGWQNNFMVLPHSFEPAFYCDNITPDPDKFLLVYTGYTDAFRTLMPLVHALIRLKRRNSPALSSLRIRIIGNNSHRMRDAVTMHDLTEWISFLPPVDYYASLKAMQQADCLIHVDADFPELRPGGSVYFAGKLADYMGAMRPVLAITGEGTPACRIVTLAGGVTCAQSQTDKLSDILEQIVFEKLSTKYPTGMSITPAQRAFREQFKAQRVATLFDEEVSNMCTGRPAAIRSLRLLPDSSPDPAQPPVLSVVICAAETHPDSLSRCMQSILSPQTACRLDLLILTAGQSADSVIYQMAEDAAKSIPGTIRHFHLPSAQKGFGESLNLAIREARGQFFLPLAGTSFIDNFALRNLLDCLEDVGDKVDAVVADHRLLSENGELSLPVRQPASVPYGETMVFAKPPATNLSLSLEGLILRTAVLLDHDIHFSTDTLFVEAEYILYPLPFIQHIRFLGNAVVRRIVSIFPDQMLFGAPLLHYDLTENGDSHTEAMIRLIEYASRTNMDREHRDCYNHYLTELLRARYLENLVLSENREAGCRAAAGLDTRLKKDAPEWYRHMGQELRLLVAGRACSFQPLAMSTMIDVDLKRRGIERK